MRLRLKIIIIIKKTYVFEHFGKVHDQISNQSWHPKVEHHQRVGK